VYFVGVGFTLLLVQYRLRVTGYMYYLTCHVRVSAARPDQGGRAGTYSATPKHQYPYASLQDPYGRSPGSQTMFRGTAAAGRRLRDKQKVYITPSPIGVGLHNPRPMKLSISPSKLCKTDQITPTAVLKKSQ
jgi:hypothetical protein